MTKCGPKKQCVVRLGEPKCVCSIKCKGKKPSSSKPYRMNASPVKSKNRTTTAGVGYRRDKSRLSLTRNDGNIQLQSSSSVMDLVASQNYSNYRRFESGGDSSHRSELEQFHPNNHHHRRLVCGSDGRTYKSECQLQKRACRQNSISLVVAYKGHCQCEFIMEGEHM